MISENAGVFADRVFRAAKERMEDKQGEGRNRRAEVEKEVKGPKRGGSGRGRGRGRKERCLFN